MLQQSTLVPLPVATYQRTMPMPLSHPSFTLMATPEAESQETLRQLILYSLAHTKAKASRGPTPYKLSVPAALRPTNAGMFAHSQVFEKPQCDCP